MPNPTKEELIKKMQGHQGEQLAKDRDERTIPVAMTIIKAIAAHELAGKAIGSFVKDEDHKKFCKDLQLEIVTEFVNQKVRLSEAGYIFRLVHQAVENVQNMMQTNINENTNRAEKFKWGVDPQELDFSHLHEVLIEADKVGAANLKKGAEPVDESEPEKV